MEDNEISDDDDGFSFGSDITVEPDEDSQSSHRQIPKRIRWGPEVSETDGGGGGDGNAVVDSKSSGESHNKNPRVCPTIINMARPPLPPSPPFVNDNGNEGSGNQSVDMRRDERNPSPRTIVRGTRVIAPGSFDSESNDGSPTITDKPQSQQQQQQPQPHQHQQPRPSYDHGQQGESIWGQIFQTCIQLLPAFCFTIVVQFVDLMVNIHLYLIGLVIFQSMFWPAIGFIAYSIKFGNGQEGSLAKKIFEPLIPWSNGRWINTLLLELHGLIVMGATLLQLLSIQYLDITVSLTLSFLSVIILVLLQHIIHEKKCSVELVTTTILGYTGVILVTIPSVLAPHPYIQSLIYNGVAASIASSLLTIQSSFLLAYLRNQRMDDSLILSSVGLNGTLFCVIAGGIVHGLDPVKNSNGGYIAAIVLVTILGVTFLFIKKVQGKISLLKPDKSMTAPVSPQDVLPYQEGRSNGDVLFISVLKLRVLVFMFSCFWGIFKQFYRQSFPTVYSVLGVTFIIISFLFTLGFREWYAFTKSQKVGNEGEGDGGIGDQETSDEYKQESGGGEGTPPKRTIRFEFIPWLFTRESTLFISR